MSFYSLFVHGKLPFNFNYSFYGDVERENKTRG